jgi:hypothetical protein
MVLILQSQHTENPMRMSGFVSAKEIVNSTAAMINGKSAGMYAYSKLQVALMEQEDIPYIPILPCTSIDSLAPLLLKHLAALKTFMTAKKPLKSPTPYDLLQLCTTDPPMPEQTAHYLTDLFPGLRELATACTSVTSMPGSSSPAVRAAGGLSCSSQGTDAMASREIAENGQEKLKLLKEQVGEQQAANVAEFWQAEWTVD